MTGKSKTYELLLNLYFNLLGKLSGVLYSFRAGIVQRSSTLRSVAQAVVSTYRDVRLTWTPTFTAVAQMTRSSDTSSTTSRLTNSFGSLVMRTVLTGCMFLSFAMAIIVVAASKLVVTIKEKLTTK